MKNNFSSNVAHRVFKKTLSAFLKDKGAYGVDLRDSNNIIIDLWDEDYQPYQIIIKKKQVQS